MNWTDWSTTGPPPSTYWSPYGAPGGWKGSKLGLPPSGVGSLASPGSRLAARLLDALVMSPLYVGFYIVMIVWFVHQSHNLLPPQPTPSNPNPTISEHQLNNAISGFFAIFALGWLFYLTVAVLYEGGMTARYGRTLGKMWMGIRPATPDGGRLTNGRSFGRVGAIFVCGFASILDQLWCLWDDSSQCLHDKLAGTVVVNEKDPGRQQWSASPGGSQPSN